MNEIPKRADVYREVVGNFLARPEISDELKLADIFQKFRRQKVWILGTIFLVTFFSWIGIAQLVPLYTAAVQVMIGVPEEKVLDVEDVLAGMTADGIAVENEIHIIRSREIVGKTIAELGLVHDPKFNPTLRAPSVLTRIFNLRHYLPESWSAYLPVDSERQDLSQEEREAIERDIVIDEFLTKLEVIPEDNSRVIRIEITTRAPGTSQLVANTLSDFYIVSQLDAKLDATKRASAWLFERMEKLRADAQVSAQAVEMFRRESGLLQANTSGTLAEQEISALTLRYVEEQSALAGTRARLRQAESLLESPEATATASEVLKSALIIGLRHKEAELEHTLAEMTEMYGERHPNLLAARAELKDLKQTIQREVVKVIQGLRNELSVAQTRTAALASMLEQQRQALADMNVDEVRLQALQREADANQNFLELVMARFKETSAQQGFHRADARILARAALPRWPSFPNKLLLLSLAVVCSVFLGILIAFAVEQSDSGLRSMEQIEQLVGVAPLGLVPALNEFGNFGKKPAAYVLKHPNSTFSESIRTLYANLSYSSEGGPPKTLLVTSSVPHEGKTSIAVSLARILANQGQKVLLLDCDFRRGAVHEAFGVSQAPGLTDYFADAATLEAVVRRDPKTEADFISAGKHSSTPLSFQDHKKLKDLLDAFTDSRDYHLVILDSPPILAVSDTRMLAGFVDEALLVVRWAKTRRDQVNRALKEVMGTGCKVGGIALSMVDVARHSQYRFGDSGLYTGDMRRYYQN